MLLMGNDLFVANDGNNTVGEYDATTGATINASFITGLNFPIGLALSGNILFVGNSGGTVGEYNATTGAAINASFVTGVNANYLALLGNNLFESNYGPGTVGEYNATTGATISTSFITVTGDAAGLALSTSSVPEPSTWSITALGGVVLLGTMLWKKRQSA